MVMETKKKEDDTLEMKVRIFQIDMNRDKKNACFMNYEWLMKKGYQVEPAIYDCVYEGELNCKSLESVYAMFNLHHPKDYRARSLSVSDVVEISAVSEGDFAALGYYFCDTVGFKEIEFSAGVFPVKTAVREGKDHDEAAR